MEGPVKIGIIIICCLFILVIILLSLREIPNDPVDIRQPYNIRSNHTLGFLTPKDDKLYVSDKLEGNLSVWYEAYAPSTPVSGFLNLSTGKLISRDDDIVRVDGVNFEDSNSVFNVGFTTKTVFTLADQTTGLLVTIGDDNYCYMSEQLFGTDEAKQEFQLFVPA